MEGSGASASTALLSAKAVPSSSVDSAYGAVLHGSPGSSHAAAASTTLIGVPAAGSSAAMLIGLQGQQAHGAAVRTSGRAPAPAVHVRHVTYSVQPARRLDSAAAVAAAVLRRPVPARTVLHDLSFDVPPATMLAILGSSGSGKTTLLDVMACRQDGGVRTGEVRVGDARSTPALLRKVGGYVVQEDRLLPLLTVRETLTFVANMKMPVGWTADQKAHRVDEVMSELGLRHVADSRIGGTTLRGISGGERRRVSIAGQLLLDPSLLFLDEPTSGLDAFTAFHICESLQRLAHAGRTVITTIHAPRTDICNLFDQLMLLTQGHIAFMGAPAAMPGYFAQLGFPCPPYTNPCDYYVDITTVSYRSAESEERTRATVAGIVAAFSEKNAAATSPELDRASAAAAAKAATEMAATKDGADPDARPGWGRQFLFLVNRTIHHQLMDHSTLALELVQGGVMSLVIGTVFYMLGSDQISISDRFGCLYIITTLYLFMVILSTIAQCTLKRRWDSGVDLFLTAHPGPWSHLNPVDAKRPPFYIERLDGLYDLEPYMAAELLGELPFVIFFALIYALPAYFMAALDLDPVKISLYVAAIFLGLYASRSLACAVSAGIVRFQQAAFFANFLYTLQILAGGFLFNVNDIWVGLSWLNYISYTAFTYEAVATTEFAGLTFVCPEYSAYNVSCPISTGEEALQSAGLEDASAWISLVSCTAFIVGCRVVQYLCLWLVDQRPR